MSVYRRVKLLLPILVVVIIQFSCRKYDKIDSSPDLRLSFSTDTVFFDTLFPSIGSVTKGLTVYNPNEGKVKITSIRLYGGNSSSYRMNVDGTPGFEVNDIEIPGKDSLFVFVKVTIDPGNHTTPFVVDDSIRFETNGNIQQIKLVAWGREAVFHRDEIIRGTMEWDSLRAHVIYGSVRVDTGAMLTIHEGTRIYFHMDAWLAVSHLASLRVNGTIQHPVSFQGDRLDPFYRDLPGQWSGIFLEKGSNGHEISNAMIRNGRYGLVIEEAEKSTPPMLIMNNTIIQNMTGYGIYAQGSAIEATNCVIGDCGTACLDIQHGGDYAFRYLTIGNYWYTSVRNSPSVILSNYTYDTAGKQIFKPLAAWFANAIIYGANEEELRFDSAGGYLFDWRFDHAILKTQQPLNKPQRYIDCMANKDPLFVAPDEWNYRIDSLSPAIGKGYDLGVLFDIRGIQRSNPPALGAYEWKSSGGR